MAMSAEPGTFGVATYNLNYANRRGDQVLDAIKTAEPDVLFLQETTPQSEQFLRQQLASTHPHFYAVGHDGRYWAERFAFASKRPLRDIKFTPPTAGLFGFFSAVWDDDHGSIRLVNVHLTPFLWKRDATIADAMNLLAEPEDKHAREVAAILASIDLNQPTIVAGDFNSLSKFVAPQKLTESGMRDAFAAVHDNADAQPTWRWPTRPVPAAFRVDYIFHSSHFTTERAEIVRRDGSDHSMVFARLKRK